MTSLPSGGFGFGRFAYGDVRVVRLDDPHYWLYYTSSIDEGPLSASSNSGPSSKAIIELSTSAYRQVKGRLNVFEIIYRGTNLIPTRGKEKFIFEKVLKEHLRDVVE
ncbi:hypothetical protein PAXRUDRAFT_831782 [Paxillus rubicundulus Ve08.2h10]|uniref:Uncharacterized protein n=1 Tax=Paxillus rubicundulus Ve08.2h10 TaxID=930991 RepID=A0A0D0DZW3_9AGAM|nr:hypothetical protein PAXRUDRAFT_831782 [Paxillus rubicundulus Ve08.2h10]